MPARERLISDGPYVNADLVRMALELELQAHHTGDLHIASVLRRAATKLRETFALLEQLP